MSLGRSLANIVTLGLWSFTDPDIEEFWKPIKGNVTLIYNGRRQADADIVMAEFKWLKKDWSKDRKAVLIPSYKDSDALCEWLEGNSTMFISKEGFEMRVWAPMYQAYTREHNNRTEIFTADGYCILCKECGSHLAYGKTVQKRHKCSEHPKAGAFVTKEKKTSDHEYINGSGSYWGVNFDYWDQYEDDDD